RADEPHSVRLLRMRLEDAVQRRLPSGEPVAAFLSGGIDSSLVVALARRLHDRPVLTYSVSFGAGYANELEWSSLVAEHCGTELLGDGRNAAHDDRYAREKSYLRAHQKCYDDLPSMLMSDVRAALANEILESRLVEHLADGRWTSFVTRLMALNVTFKGAHHIL